VSEVLVAWGADGGTRRLRLGELIHKGGGAGRICALQDDPRTVVKLYHEPAKAAHYAPKIAAMLERPPDLPAIERDGRRYVQLAWPTALVEDASGRFAGFTMPFIDLSRADSLDTLLVKALRSHRGLPENYAYRVFAAQNVASMVTELHRLGHHVIDLKPQNFSVYKDNMYVAVVDCDGLSIAGGDGRRFPGHQFTDGYRAPEAARKGLAPEELGEAQDRFALAVVLFQLLNNGIHPFQGVPLRRGLELGTEQERINAWRYPYGPRANGVQGPAPASIHETLEDGTLELFRRAFEGRHRPSARAWRDHLRGLIEGEALQRCYANPAAHAHFSKGCGLCRLDARIRETAKAAKAHRPQTRYRARPTFGTRAWPRARPRVVIRTRGGGSAPYRPVRPRPRPQRPQAPNLAAMTLRQGARALIVWLWGTLHYWGALAVQRQPWLGALWAVVEFFARVVFVVAGWLWGLLRRLLLGTPEAGPPPLAAGWGGRLVAFLVYGLFAANLLVIAGIMPTLAEPRGFCWLADLIEPCWLLLEPAAPRSQKLEALQAYTFFYLFWSSVAALILSYIARANTRGTRVESHATWVIWTFWQSVPVLPVAVLALKLGVLWPLLYVVWLLYRCAKGLALLLRRRPISAPTALL